MSTGLSRAGAIGCLIASASSPLLRLFACVRRRKDGAAAVEFAVALPLLAGILLPMLDIGMATYQEMQVIDAAQAGADYALEHGWNSTAIQSAVTNATNLAGVSASPSPSNFCGCPSGSAVASATCGSTCASGLVAGSYVTVGAQVTFTPLVPYSGFGSSVVLHGTSTVRIQ